MAEENIADVTSHISRLKELGQAAKELFNDNSLVVKTGMLAWKHYQVNSLLLPRFTELGKAIIETEKLVLPFVISDAEQFKQRFFYVTGNITSIEKILSELDFAVNDARSMLYSVSDNGSIDITIEGNKITDMLNEETKKAIRAQYSVLRRRLKDQIIRDSAKLTGYLAELKKVHSEGVVKAISGAPGRISEILSDPNAKSMPNPAKTRGRFLAKTLQNLEKYMSKDLDDFKGFIASMQSEASLYLERVDETEKTISDMKVMAQKLAKSEIARGDDIISEASELRAQMQAYITDMQGFNQLVESHLDAKAREVIMQYQQRARAIQQQVEAIYASSNQIKILESNIFGKMPHHDYINMMPINNTISNRSDTTSMRRQH